MRGLALLWLALAAAGCRDRGPSVEQVAQARADVGAAAEISLDLEAQRRAGVVVEKVSRRALPEVLQATGRITINEDRTWRIGAVTDGRITHLYVNVGDRVEAGHVLARLYSHDIHEARAEYQRAISELDRLKAGLEFARRQRDRTRRLFELKAASQQQVEQAESEYKNAWAAVAHGEVELDRTRRHLTDFLRVPADAPPGYPATGEESQDGLVPVTSPAAGTLLQRRVSIGTVVERSAELFVVTDLATLWMIAAVSEEHLSQLRIGMPVRVQVQAYPERFFPGHITRLGEELDPTTRTIMARVELPNPQGLLKPEMYAVAELELGRSLPAIFVPQTAIQEIEGRPAVFVRTASDRFAVRPVETGRPFGALRLIVSGLEPGDWVVTQGSFVLKSLLSEVAQGSS